MKWIYDIYIINKVYNKDQNEFQQFNGILISQNGVVDWKQTYTTLKKNFCKVLR